MFLTRQKFCCSVTTCSCRMFLTREIFCCPATTRTECFSPDSSAVLLPQLQNVSHQRNILLFCYHNCRMFLTREIFCSSSTTIAECFSPEKHSAPLLPQLQNVSHKRNSAPLLPQLQNVSHQRKILLLCSHKGRMFLIGELFCCSGTTVAEFSRECYSTLISDLR